TQYLWWRSTGPALVRPATPRCKHQIGLSRGFDQHQRFPLNTQWLREGMRKTPMPTGEHGKQLHTRLALLGGLGLASCAITRVVRSSLRELEESRPSIVAAADRERHRIERDLHDGAQQRLVAVRIKLELADELMEIDSAHAHQ